MFLYHQLKDSFGVKIPVKHNTWTAHPPSKTNSHYRSCALKFNSTGGCLDCDYPAHHTKELTKHKMHHHGGHKNHF